MGKNDLYCRNYNCIVMLYYVTFWRPSLTSSNETFLNTDCWNVVKKKKIKISVNISPREPYGETLLTSLWTSGFEGKRVILLINSKISQSITCISFCFYLSLLDWLYCTCKEILNWTWTSCSHCSANIFLLGSFYFPKFVEAGGGFNLQELAKVWAVYGQLYFPGMLILSVFISAILFLKCTVHLEKYKKTHSVHPCNSYTSPCLNMLQLGRHISRSWQKSSELLNSFSRLTTLPLLYWNSKQHCQLFPAMGKLSFYIIEISRGSVVL